jgi:hypothetical protein
VQVALKLIHDFSIDNNGQRPAAWLKGGNKYTLEAATLTEWSIYEKLGATKGISKRPYQGVPYVLEHGKHSAARIVAGTPTVPFTPTSPCKNPHLSLQQAL